LVNYGQKSFKTLAPELNEEEIEVMQRFTGYIVNFVTLVKPTPDDTWSL
jgi:hypothetical protein